MIPACVCLTPQQSCKKMKRGIALLKTKECIKIKDGERENGSGCQIPDIRAELLKLPSAVAPCLADLFLIKRPRNLT